MCYAHAYVHALYTTHIARALAWCVPLAWTSPAHGPTCVAACVVSPMPSSCMARASCWRGVSGNDVVLDVGAHWPAELARVPLGHRTQRCTAVPLLAATAITVLELAGGLRHAQLVTVCSRAGDHSWVRVTPVRKS